MGDVPLCYPKIPRLKKLRAKGDALYGRSVAFEKYDGTNLHWVVEDGKVVAFGARRTRFPFTDEGIEDFLAYHKGLENAPELIEGKPLPKGSAILFTEYLGPGSFNGEHDPEADPAEFRLVLIDVERDGSMLPPEDFLAFAVTLGWPDVARVVWRGSLIAGGFSNFLHSLRGGSTGVVEGVVVKNAHGTFKVKTDEWEARLAESRETK